MNNLKTTVLFILIIFCCTWQLSAQEVTLKFSSTGTMIPTESKLVTAEANAAIRENDSTDIDKRGYHPKKDWLLNKHTNPDALPNGDDPAWQKKYQDEDGNDRSHGAVLAGWNGIASDGNFYPGDPSLDVGTNYVIQMTNNGSGMGGQYAIWEKNGTVTLAETFLQTLSGFNGNGDPIVIYDQLAQRWLLTEFKPNVSGSQGMIIAVSQTSNPLGAYYIYNIDDLPEFPDYPKFGVWNDSYIMTTNESMGTMYALDKQAMLTGASADWLRWSLTDFPGFGIQAPTPVDGQGPSILASQDPMIIRMADDGWDAAITADRLEYFTIDVNWSNTAAATTTGPTFLLTDPYDTALCGYNYTTCIDQPGTTQDLDNLKEMIMNKAEYRDFGSYASIVCNHTVDVNNTDRHGIRWYELRKPTAGSWSVYQQGTYSPNTTQRWMGAITQNAYGEILLAYNVADGSTFPGLRFTGRESGDPLGTMTIAETVIVNGTTFNGSNRNGDYNTAVVDPVDQSFWFTGHYNPTNAWATYVSHISAGGPGCSGSLVLNGVLDGDYTSSGTIYTDGSVPSGNDVGLYAPGITTIDDGFSTSFGGDLIASFGDCSVFAPPSNEEENAIIMRDRNPDQQNQVPVLLQQIPDPERVKQDRNAEKLIPSAAKKVLTAEEQSAIEKQIARDRKSGN